MAIAAVARRIGGALWVLPLLLTSCYLPQRAGWPSIRKATYGYHFAPNKDSEQLKATIYRRDGKPLYCLDARFCWRDFEDEGDYYFSGALDCRFYPLDKSSPYPTLLQNSANATRDWQTFGRFTGAELIGLAGADASRSVIQRCGVRGMIIEIEVFNVKEQDGRIASLDMSFAVRNSSGKERLQTNGSIAAQYP